MYIYILFYILYIYIYIYTYIYIYITYTSGIMGKGLYIDFSSIWKPVEKKTKCRADRPYGNSANLYYF